MEATNESRLGEVLSQIVDRLEDANAATRLTQDPVSRFTQISGVRAAAPPAPAENQSMVRGFAYAALNVLNPIRANSPASFISNLFLGPVWRGLFSLFGNGDDQPEPVLNRFLRPEDVSSAVSAQTDASGRSAALGSDSFGQTRSTPTAPAMQINIQALDARSVMERSEEIASAVRQAMLTNHPINESLSEL
jgi:hypothetical protein